MNDIIDQSSGRNKVRNFAEHRGGMSSFSATPFRIRLQGLFTTRIQDEISSLATDIFEAFRRGDPPPDLRRLIDDRKIELEEILPWISEREEAEALRLHGQSGADLIRPAALRELINEVMEDFNIDAVRDRARAVAAAAAAAQAGRKRKKKKHSKKKKKKSPKKKKPTKKPRRRRRTGKRK